MDNHVAIEPVRNCCQVVEWLHCLDHRYMPATDVEACSVCSDQLNHDYRGHIDIALPYIELSHILHQCNNG